jgi:alanine racemase
MRPLRVPESCLAWVEVDLSAIRHNFRELRRLAHARSSCSAGAEPELLAVVKADAYGHGMFEVAAAIERSGGRFFVVSNVLEGGLLRTSGNRHRIMVLEAALPVQARELFRHELVPALSSLELARELDRLARRAGRRFPVHIKVDTGMGRMGVWHAQVPDFIQALRAFPNLEIEGLLTHFPLADSDRKYTGAQIRLFSALADRLRNSGVALRYLHAANSMGLGGYDNTCFNLVRPGLMLYGLYPCASLARRIELKPAMSLKARILLLKTIHKGRGVSYGHTFRAARDIRAAVLPVGYSDGYLRALSGKSRVLVNGVYCPVLGRVTMDQIVVDVSRAGQVCAGDEVVLLGQQKNRRISADELAGKAGTISYEIVCSLGNRLPRFYTG